MEIVIPLLPPKFGYIEVIDANGEHIYQPTSEQLLQDEKLAKSENEKAKLDERIAALEAAIIDLMGVIQSV